jgi:hypothetical protein
MAPLLSVRAELTRHRVAALESVALMRATNADIWEIIRKSRDIIKERRKALK